VCLENALREASSRRAGINREQLRAIEYLQADAAVRRKLVGKKRLLLSDHQRRRLTPNRARRRKTTAQDGL